MQSLRKIEKEKQRVHHLRALSKIFASPMKSLLTMMQSKTMPVKDLRREVPVGQRVMMPVGQRVDHLRPLST